MESQQNMDQEAPNIHSQNLKEEFYKWFESRGLLSDLRAYMRQLMVKALEESNKNNKTARSRKASSSPKLQAINLLVVDYLFHEDYFYTVSVFASEAQILENLPQYSRYITQTVREHRWDPSSLPRFSQQETEDILDTLRLPPTQRETQHATQLYLSGHESLLTCVVRTLSSSHFTLSLDQECNMPALPDDVNDDNNTVEYSYQLWSQEIQDLLLMAGVKIQHIRRMQLKWAQTVEEEKCKAKKEAVDELAVQQAEWQQATEQRLRTEFLKQMQVEQQELREQESRIELKEQGLASLAGELAGLHDDIKERLSQIQIQSEELHEQALQQASDRRDLEERLSQVQIREEHLEHAIASFQEETSEIVREVEEDHMSEFDVRHETSKITTLTRDAAVQVVAEEEMPETGVDMCTQTVEAVVSAFTQTQDTVDHEQQTSFDSQPNQELLHQLQMDRDKINEMQEENLELRAFALQQRHRIDELTNRAASLSSQLEESRIAVSVLSGRESAVVVASPPQPAQPPPVLIAPTFGYNNPQRIGAGEESLFAPRSQQNMPRPDNRRRPLRFAFSQNTAPTSEESSPTDEIIQNARTRIHQLEAESLAVQRNYQEFQNRLFTTDSMMFPPLGTPRIPNPITRVRRNEINLLPYPHLPQAPTGSNYCRSHSRQTQTHNDENNDSSSDPAASLYMTSRIESLTNSRRIFHPRSIRQFDRWKQFKKKFQRRETFDQHRRNQVISNSNTSSDDDEGLLRNIRRHETNKHRKTHENEHTNSPVQKVCESGITNDSKLEHITGSKSRQNSSDRLLGTEPLDLSTIQEASGSKTKPATSFKEEKLKLELEKSEKLIESVKGLLEAQNNINKAASTMSNESLAVESLPRDSQDGSQREIVKTDTSLITTIQNDNPDISNVSKTESTIKPASSKEMGKPFSSEYLKEFIIKGVQSVHSESDSDEEVLDLLNTNRPVPLRVPTLSLVGSGLTVNSEEYIDPVSVNSPGIVEQDNGERETTSVTSGSDILRELNPSKTESSESVLSTGWADNSKHSSDFWN